MAARGKQTENNVTKPLTLYWISLDATKDDRP